MSSPVTQQTGTAADLLHYDKIQHTTKQCERLTRVATASENWILKDWDNEAYCIRFDSNFSKKHLFTFSKDQQRTVEKAKDLAKTSGKGDLENWHDAEMELLKGKIAKNLDKRAVAGICNCTHTFIQHLQNNPAPPPNKLPGGCTICPCAAFKTPYGIARQYVGKPTHDPLSGATTTRNTCIILNWVPKAEFEEVVVKSIQAVEKPPGWVKGQPLSVPVLLPNKSNKILASRCLKWDFGLGRRGAVLVSIKNVAAATVTHNDFQGCWVQAVKTASAWGQQTWEIYHMDTGNPAAHAAHVPF